MNKFVANTAVNSVGDMRMWGKWKRWNIPEDPPTWREVLMEMLESTPSDVLDRCVQQVGRHGDGNFTVAVLNPVPSYEDPLGQSGFVSWKFVYEVNDDRE